MKNMKKLFSLVLALVMVMGLTVAAGAASAPVQVAEAGGTDATITINNASKGVTYYVYKVFGATVSAANDADGKSKSIAYIFDGDLVEAGLDSVFTKVTGTNYVQMVKDADESAVLKAVEDYALTTVPVNGESGTVSADGGKLQFKVAYGYYVIKSNLSTDVKLTVDSTNPNAEVNDKSTADKPHFDPDNGKKADKETYKIGETVTYTVNFITANWCGEGKDAKQIKSYTFTDTLPGFLSDVNVISVKVKQTGKDDETITKVFDNKSMTIDWVDTYGEGSDATYASKYDNGAVIEIKYSARVNGTATIGSEGNENAISATWNYIDNTPMDEKDKPTDAKEKVYTYSFEMVKVNNNNEPLAEASFSLYNAESEGAPVNLVKVADNVYRLAIAEGDKKDDEKDLVTVIETPADGKITIQGLSNGSYWMEETKAPEGYNKLTNREKVVINDANVTSSATEGFRVVNQTGTELPATGGIGTTIFTVVGGVLMIGAAILFLTKKRSEV